MWINWINYANKIQATNSISIKSEIDFVFFSNLNICDVVLFFPSNSIKLVAASRQLLIGISLWKLYAKELLNNFY